MKPEEGREKATFESLAHVVQEISRSITASETGQRFTSSEIRYENPRQIFHDSAVYGLLLGTFIKVNFHLFYWSEDSHSVMVDGKTLLLNAGDDKIRNFYKEVCNVIAGQCKMCLDSANLD